MKSLIVVCLIGGGLMYVAAQDAVRPELQKGVSVSMAVASHAVEMRAADEQGSTVIALTADGNIYNGVQRIGLASLGQIGNRTVYIKADARVPYQQILSVLDSLSGKPVVLLTASTAAPESGQYTPPYGVKVTLGQ